MRRRPAKAGTCVTLFALLLFALTFVHQNAFKIGTAASRLDLLHALVLKSTVRIDDYHENTNDEALFKGSHYSDKPPGVAALALVPFMVSAAVFPLAGIGVDSEDGWLLSSWIACAGSLGIIAALGGTLLFSWLSKYVPARAALLTTLALFLGAAPLPYATLLYSHALVVGLLAIVIWAIDGREPSPSRPDPPLENSVHGSCATRGREWLRKNRTELLAGFACGWALASEYTAGLAVIGVFLWVLSLGGRHLLPFCLAAIPPLLLIPAYSWACLGDPFSLPYSYMPAPEMKEGWYAIKQPNLPTAFKLIFGPERGLLFWTPFLVMATAGYADVKRASRRLFWLTCLVPLIQIIVISGRTWDWKAGATIGPRLLAPILPFLALPCAYGVRRFPRFGTLLAICSVAITTFVTLTDVCVPSDLKPLEYQIALFSHGNLSPNLGLALGLPSYASVALFYAILIAGISYLWWQMCRVSPTDSMNDQELIE